MNDYNIPEEYYFRIHHVRPRFKGDIENVLIYLAEEITAIGSCPKDEFVRKINDAIYRYPGNAHREIKTINNWRTEISSLFGFIVQDGECFAPGRRAVELAKNQDLVAFFKAYLFCFQYPGAHIKSHAVLEQIQMGIHFKPAQYILRLLRYACEKEGHNVGLTKFEICHCIFNDLRCTRDNEDVARAWRRIRENRKNNVQYDQTGDVVRYAGDIVDYMEIANLLITYDSRTYYLNTLEEEAIIKFVESTEWYGGYDYMITRRIGSLPDVNECREGWFAYANRDLSDTDFSTDILAYIASDADELAALKRGAVVREEQGESSAEAIAKQKMQGDSFLDDRISAGTKDFTTKDIGDIGESLVHSHECMRVKIGGREDLIHLIKRIPTQFAVGYDISSVELDERKRYIEVKTTISAKPLHFNKVHLTRNEWNTANSTRDRYYVYRLMISKTEKKLFLLQDPVGLYKKDLIDMVPSNGVEITFNPNQVGQFEELLTWKA